MQRLFSEARTVQSSPCGVLERVEKRSKGAHIYYSLLITPASSLSIFSTTPAGLEDADFESSLKQLLNSSDGKLFS